jgi:hypothetical protein
MTHGMLVVGLMGTKTKKQKTGIILDATLV